MFNFHLYIIIQIRKIVSSFLSQNFVIDRAIRKYETRDKFAIGGSGILGHPVYREICAQHFAQLLGRFNRRVSARNSYIIAGIPQPYRVTCAGLYEENLGFCLLTKARSIRPAPFLARLSSIERSSEILLGIG